MCMKESKELYGRVLKGGKGRKTDVIISQSQKKIQKLNIHYILQILFF